MHPDFGMIGTSAFWLTVLSITTIATVETLASARAVDKLDPYKRKTDLDKDLVGVGLSTMISGALGGLPIITVIVRSTVNINHHAKTKWSNWGCNDLVDTEVYKVGGINYLSEDGKNSL